MSEAKTSLIHSELPVNSWAISFPDVEATRPSRCPKCGKAAHRRDGRLRLYGHGTRLRGVWGPESTAGESLLWEIRVRRYLCVDCGACPTVVPAGLGRAYRYSLSAIAMALTLWAMWRVSAARVRQRVSPFRRVGVSEPTRWRSLRRWTRRARELFELATEPAGSATREVAQRVAHLVLSRGPEGRTELDRVFAGAQVR